MESDRSNGLVGVFTIASNRRHREVCLLSVFHHYVLVEGDLVRCQDLLLTAGLLGLVR